MSQSQFQSQSPPTRAALLPDVARAVDLVRSQPIAGVIVLKFDDVGVHPSEAPPADVPVVAAAGASRRGAPRPHALLACVGAAAVAARWMDRQLLG